MDGVVTEVGGQIRSLSYEELLQIRFKAYRNGNWKRLEEVKKAFRATLQLAKLRGRIVNPSLLERVKNIVFTLLQPPATKILQLGREHASRLFRHYLINGVFKWAPNVRSWLKDLDYLLWLHRVSFLQSKNESSAFNIG